MSIFFLAYVTDAARLSVNNRHFFCHIYFTFLRSSDSLGGALVFFVLSSHTDIVIWNYRGKPRVASLYPPPPIPLAEIVAQDLPNTKEWCCRISHAVHYGCDGGILFAEIGYYSHAKNKTACYCLTIS
jgi:hypothetical protein